MIWPPSLTWFKDIFVKDPPPGTSDAMVLLHAEDEEGTPRHISAMPSAVHVPNEKTLAWVSEMPFDVIGQGGIHGGGGTISSTKQGNYQVATAIVSGNKGETHHYHVRFFKNAGDRPDRPFAEDLSSPIIIID
jgi:hypothetical protein